MSKDRYRELSRNISDLPLYHQAWWLDAVCGRDHWEVTMIEKEGLLIAAWPYLLKKKFNYNVQIMPKLTQRLGPWVREVFGDSLQSKEYQFNLISKLLEMKPVAHYESANFTLKMRHSDLMANKGFNESIRNTYLIHPSSVDQAWNQISSKTRHDVNKATKENLTFRIENHSRQAIELIKKHVINKTGNFVLNDNELDYFFANISDANPRFLSLENSKHELVSSIFLVEDKSTVYYLLSGATNQRIRGANSLLLWHGIKDAMERSKTFDFEGSMVEGIARYFKSFGAEMTHYYNYSIYRSRVIYFYHKNILKIKC